MELVDKLSSRLFWDVDTTKLNPEQHARFIIIRVMERGDINDVRLIWSLYRREKIREALIKARHLSPKTIAFFANQFCIPPTMFRAYENSREANEHVWQ